MNNVCVFAEIESRIYKASDPDISINLRKRSKLFKGLHLEFCNKESRAPFVMEKQCQFMKIFEHKVPKN